MKSSYLISTAAFAASIFVTSMSGQDLPVYPCMLSEEEMMGMRGKYLKDFVRSPSITAAPLVTDVTGAVPVLSRLFPNEVMTPERRKYLEGPKKYLTFTFHAPVSATDDDSIQYIGEVKMRAYKTLKEAEDGYVYRFAFLQLEFTPETFTGQPLGEASAYIRDAGADAKVCFLRKNVVIEVQSPIGVRTYPNRDKGRIWPRTLDPAIGEKCEAIAREVDNFFAQN